MGGLSKMQTLNRELPMTHVVDKVSPNDVVMLWRRSLNPRSCAGESPLVLGCCSAGCVDCHYGNGGVHDDEEDDGCAGWAVLGQNSMEGRWLVAAPSAPLRRLGPGTVFPACSDEGARLRLDRCRKRATRTRVT
ncbi:hypothetical protein INR49_032144 [Caranx melampygus]|nr:hypothetical protein INR49_032144 [Caranx melampygus]